MKGRNKMLGMGLISLSVDNELKLFMAFFIETDLFSLLHHPSGMFSVPATQFANFLHRFSIHSLKFLAQFAGHVTKVLELLKGGQLNFEFGLLHALLLIELQLLFPWSFVALLASTCTTAIANDIVVVAHPFAIMDITDAVVVESAAAACAWCVVFAVVIVAASAVGVHFYCSYPSWMENC